MKRKEKRRQREQEELSTTIEYSLLDSESYTSRELRPAQEARRRRRELEQERNAEKKAKRASRARKRRAVIGAFVLFALVLAAVVGNNVLELFRLINEKNAVEAELKELNRQEGALEKELEQVNTDEYIEQQARSELKMVKPEELLYVYDDSAAQEDSPSGDEDEPFIDDGKNKDN